MVLDTMDEAKSFMSTLLDAYKAKDFQDKLWASFKEANGDALEIMKGRAALLPDIQNPVYEKFGLEAGKKGTAQSMEGLGQHKYDDEMMGYHTRLMWIVDPAEQMLDWDLVPDAQIPRPEKKRFKVVGGGDNGGVVVRRGKNLLTQPYKYRLRTGAIVAPMEDPVDGRLHYERVEGDGPDYGWVSLKVGGKDLLEPTY